jgi:hypothetical protein
VDRTPQRQAAALRDALLRGWLGHADRRWRRVALELLMHTDMPRGPRAALELSAEAVACHRDVDAGVRAAARALRRVVAATVPGPTELAAQLQAGTWVEFDVIPTATLRQVVPDLLRRLRDPSPDERPDVLSALGRALQRTDVTLDGHLPELVAIVGRQQITVYRGTATLDELAAEEAQLAHIVDTMRAVTRPPQITPTPRRFWRTAGQFALWCLGFSARSAA